MWIYLFFLPLQLVDQFGWYTILGVGIAAFIYLGLVAAGEEIEQPFGAPRPFLLPSFPPTNLLFPSLLSNSRSTGYDEVCPPPL